MMEISETEEEAVAKELLFLSWSSSHISVIVKSVSGGYISLFDIFFLYLINLFFFFHLHLRKWQVIIEPLDRNLVWFPWKAVILIYLTYIILWFFFPINSSCKELIKMKLYSQVMIDSLPERSVIFLVTNILKCRYIIGLVKKFRFPFTKAKSIE